MKGKYLKGIRVFLALLFFIPLTLFFVDFTNNLPLSMHALAHIQFIPALLAGMWFVVAALLLLTFIFGRIYCSTICPAGIFQDLIIRLSGRGKKRNKYKKWFAYRKPYNVFRYVLLFIINVTFIFGFLELLLLLDPYSNYARIASNLFRPCIVSCNNLLATGLMALDNYSLYHVTIYHITTVSFIIALVAFVVLLLMTLLRGRLFCNTLCPVGGILSLVSRFSLFKMNINPQLCNSCGSCERTCKSECIDGKGKVIDSSRCVNCFNCETTCNKHALSYKFVFDLHKKQSIDKKQNNQEESIDRTNTRRTFISTTVFLAAAATKMSAKARLKQPSNLALAPITPITPPGSIGRERFTDLCTACHLCVVKCPTQILRPAGMEYGYDFLLKPHIVYDSAYCNYECKICSDVCPNSAIINLSEETKATTQIGVAQFEKDICITYVDGTDCGACSEHCPTQAVKMIPYKGSLRVPEVDASICIGCGGCEYICPVRPQRAIHIVANKVHKCVERPVYEKVEEKIIDDFGF